MKTATLVLVLSLAGQAADKVSFVKDVMPILNKAGCTSGPCHGAAKGKNGFKLSLRGYDPEFDYRALLHDMAGRRYNRTDPASSLMLVKPAQQLPHGGGQRFDADSPYYKTILQWLRDGAEFGDPVSAQVAKLVVEPPELLFQKPGEGQPLQVTAHYADGSQRVVTKEAQYTSSTPTVADVSDAGAVKTERKGESALLVRYEGKLAVVNVTVLPDKPGFAWKPIPENNYVDRFINAKLRKVKVLPSETASDAEFLRRVSYDLAGLPPSLEEVRGFVADKNPAKRSRLIDKLMARPEFVDHWSVKWGDLLQVSRTRLGDKGMWAFREWIREALAGNKPYDQMARELITARGSTFQNPPANFFRFTRDPKVAMETTTQLFLGVRMVCAQCHDHPFEQWTQNQYFSLSAFFAGVGIKDGMDANEEIVYEKREENEVKHPKDGRIMSPKFLFGGDKLAPGEADPRVALANWLTSRENALFAKAMANRMWSYFFGRGIIEPVDDIRASNPPANAPLLEALTKDFVAHNFDTRHLIRTIVNSRTYQLSYQTNEWNAGDEINFSHAQPRRLSAEQLLDGVTVATGSKPFFREAPRDFTAQQLPDPTVGRGGFLDLFGRPERQTSCECERRTDVSLVQALNLLNGATIADAIAAEDGRVSKLLLKGASDRQIIDELYLAALNRPPEPKELDYAQTYLSRGLNRAERAQDLLWALLNSNGFLFNR
ncbi:MAG: DUF1549 domain-containing protein [Acidobacteria bacterium]|nr:DUF1549 domain-containing protein [Acidobacteriota bacterium]MBI3473872.1 DUF1549 domain-containing protein [Candidatus Solibacter usitatus]